MGKRGPKNRSTKTSIVFNEQDRVDYLTGFRKRKQERIQKTKERLAKELKDEMKKAKQSAREFVLNARTTEKSSSNKVVPEIEHLLPTLTHDSESHTVTVTHIDTLVGLQDIQTENTIRASEVLDKGELKVMKSQLKTLTNTKKIKNASKQLKKGKDKHAKKKQRKTMKTKRQRHKNPAKK